MDATRRNYESGADYVLEYGELRFTFNERDFTERVEQAAVKLGFVPGPFVGSHVLRVVSSADPVGPAHEYVIVVPLDTGLKPSGVPSENRTVSVNV